jgi:hypothetical protein
LRSERYQRQKHGDHKAINGKKHSDQNECKSKSMAVRNDQKKMSDDQKAITGKGLMIGKRSKENV